MPFLGAALPWVIGSLVGTGASAGLNALSDSGSSGSAAASSTASANLDPLVKNLQSASDTTRAQGKDLSSLGTSSLAPVLDYFSKLTKGDPSALLSATAPERTRVIDQYDTARQNISQFSPRGGGTNAALATSRFNEGTDLANITATARQTAATQSANLGTTLTGLGLSADQLASSDLNTIINALLTEGGFNVQERGQNLQAVGGIGEGLGTLLGLFLTRGQKAA